MIAKTNFNLTLFLFLLGSFLLGCRSEPPKDEQKEFTVNVRIKADPGRLNPVFGVTNSISRSIYPLMFLQLGEYDPATLKLSPILCKSLDDIEEISDGPQKGLQRYNYEILPEAIWEDGSDITGHDYSFTIKSFRHPATKANIYEAYTADIVDVVVDKDNPKKFTVISKADYMLALESICSVEILPAHVYDTAGVLKNLKFDDFADAQLMDQMAANDTLFNLFAKNFNDPKFHLDQMSGAGPYYLDAWETDQFIRLKKKENWWGKAYPNRGFLKANPSTIVFQVIPDEITAITQLQDGTIDVMQIADGQNFNRLAKDSGLVDKFSFHTPQKLQYYSLLLNNRKPELNHPDTRKALAMLVNVDDIINVLEKDLGQKQVSLLSPFDDDYNNQIKPIEFDIETARKLLASQGWNDSNDNQIVDKVIDGKLIEFELDFLATKQELGKRIALLLQSNAEKLGIRINIIEKDFRLTRRENLATGDFDIVPYRTTMSLGDYDPYATWHGDNAEPIKSNYSGFSNEVADKLIEEIRITRDEDARDPLYQKLQQIVADESPVIFLYAPLEKIVVNARINPLISVKRPGFFPNAFELN